MTAPLDTTREVTIKRCMDAALLSDLHSLCFDTGWTPQSFAGLIASPGTSAFVVVSAQEEVRGFVVLRQAADEAEIITIGILPNHRRRGLACALLDHALDRSAADGIAMVHLEVSEDNAAARNFYREQGFCETGRRDAYYMAADATRKDAVVMALHLRDNTDR